MALKIDDPDVRIAGHRPQVPFVLELENAPGTNMSTNSTADTGGPLEAGVVLGVHPHVYAHLAIGTAITA